MKKIYFTITLLVATVFSCLAQNPIAQGQSQFNAGFGLSNRGIPVYIGLDHGVSRDITIGAEFSLRSYDENQFNHSIVGISANGNYHFNNLLNISSQWDFYAGLNLGFYSWNSPNAYQGSFDSGIGLGAQIGGRYYFTDRFGVNLEFGGTDVFSNGKIGISLKL